MDVDIDPHWNTVMYQLFESVPFDYTIGGRAWSPKGHFEEPRIPKVDQARTSFAKKLGMKLATTYISNPFKFQWIQMILWCPKARGDPPSIPEFTWMKILPFTYRGLCEVVSSFGRLETFWDEEIPGTLRKELKDWNLEADCQPQLNKLKCVRLMLFAIMK